MSSNVENLKTQIKEYLADKTYNYAVLLNGGWGIGKTYFIEKELIPSLKEDDCQYIIKYVSLNGCTSRDKVRSAIIDKIIGDCMSKIDIPGSLTKNSNSTKKEEQKKAIMAGGVFVKKAAMAFLSKWGFDPDGINVLSDAVAEIVDLKKYFIIVDDIERCLCSPDEILGALNEIVEHEESKMLLVTNESEIGGYNVDHNVELKYVLAANNDIRIAEAGIESKIKKTIDPEDTFTVERLRERSQSIFDNEQLTYRYKKIREKLIGVTLEYRPRLSEVMRIIISNVDINSALKKIMYSQIGMYEEYMSYYNHRNLRTFQFFISRARFLYDRCSELSITKKERNFLFPDILKECFYAALAYKAAIRKKDADLEHRLDCEFDFIEVYVTEGRILYDDVLPKLHAYYESHYSNRIPDNDEFTELARNFPSQDEKWAKEKIPLIFDHLKSGDYPIERYGDILYQIELLVSLGFEKVWVDRFYKCMKQNISKEAGTIHTIPMPKEVGLDENRMRRLKRTLAEFNSMTRSQNSWNNGRSIRRIITDETSWLSGLEDYYKENGYHANDDLFSINNVKIISKRIIESSQEELVRFYTLLQYYEKDFLPTPDDKSSIKKIIEKLQEFYTNNQSLDKIKKYDLRKICTILGRMSSKTPEDRWISF